MQLLQQILQSAVQARAVRVDLSAHDLARFVAEDQSETQMQNSAALTEQQIQELATLLLEKPIGPELLEGRVEIPRLGDLWLLATNRPRMQLVIFLPKGHALFQEAKKQILSTQLTPAADASGKPAKPVFKQERSAALNASDIPTDIFLKAAPPGKKDAKKPVAKTAPPPPAPVIEAPVASISVAQSVPVPVSVPVAPTQDSNADVNATEIEVSRVPSGSPPAIEAILHFMLSQRASDVHFTSGEPLAMRIDGEIKRFPEHRFNNEQLENLLYEIAPDYYLKQFKGENDTDFAYELKGVARFRVNLFRERKGIGAVLRHIPNDILSFEKLNLPSALGRFCMLNKGLIVVTGPTGSGKSTTLAALVDRINETRHDHILTLEDPIEFVHPQKNCLIRQREIHRHTKSFSRALRAALREDPDIVLVGELRDLETTSAAIEIAETGHLVLGTLHTTTAISTVDRIIDQYPADQQAQIRTMLSESLRGVVAQTLLKKKGGGRVAALEVLVVNTAISSLIREGKTHMIANIMQSQKAEGNQMLNDALFKLVQSGIVDAEEAYMKSVQKGAFLEKLRQEGIDTSWMKPLQTAS